MMSDNDEKNKKMKKHFLHLSGQLIEKKKFKTQNKPKETRKLQQLYSELDKSSKWHSTPKKYDNSVIPAAYKRSQQVNKQQIHRFSAHS